MPLGDFYLRDPATDVYGVVHPAGPVLGWANDDPDWARYWGMDPELYVPDLIVLWRPNEYWPSGRGQGARFAKSAVNLAQVLSAQVGAASQGFAVRDAREVDILAPVGAKVRYRVGSASERAERTAGGDGLSVLITGSGSAVEVPLAKGDMLHVVADSTQATVVAVELRFVLFHPD